MVYTCVLYSIVCRKTSSALTIQLNAVWRMRAGVDSRTAIYVQTLYIHVLRLQCRSIIQLVEVYHPKVKSSCINFIAFHFSFLPVFLCIILFIICFCFYLPFLFLPCIAQNPCL